MHTLALPCPTLIGRANDLATLHLLVDLAGKGQGGVALISGDAGIGKSRLIAEAKAYAASHNVLPVQGSCFPADVAAPYASLLDLLRFLFDQYPWTRSFALTPQVVQAFQPWFSHLAPENTVPPVSSSSAHAQAPTEKRQLFERISQYLIALSAQQPLLIIVEDLHWSDETSLELLHYLARRSRTCGLLLLLSYRSEEVNAALRNFLAQIDRERLAQELHLSPLLPAEVEAMVQTCLSLPRIGLPALFYAIYPLSEGNPFFLEELLKALVTAGELFVEDGRWLYKPHNIMHPPRSVRAAVQQRVALLSEQAGEVVTLAADAGRRFEFALLLHLTGVQEAVLLQALKELIAAQLVVEESAEQFSFRHALTRQAIYTQLLARERQTLHRLVAEAMEHLYGSMLDAHLADLAYHFSQAGAWEKALEYGQRAGERALVLYAPRPALEHLTWAVQAVSHLAAPPPPTLYRARGQAYETLGEFELARADYQHALALAQQTLDARMEWQCLLDLGFLWARRDYSQAGQWFHRALDLAQALADPRLQAKSLNRLGSWLVYTGRVAEGIGAHQQALHLFEALADTRGMAETFDLLGTANCLAGDLVTAVQVSGQAVALFRNGGDLSSLATSLSLRAGYSLSETTFSPLRTRDECVQEAAEALHLSHQITAPGAEAWALLILGYVLAHFGEFGSALAHARQACRIATEIGHRQWAAAAHCTLGVTYLLQLEPSCARDALEIGMALAREGGSTWWMIQTTILLARVYLLQNELEQAEAALEAFLPREQRPRDLAERSARLVWGELALAQGQPDLALQIAQELWETVPGAATLPGSQPIPQLLKLQGEALMALGHVEEAIPALQEAKRGTMQRYERARLWYICGLLGRAYRLAGQEKLARQELLAARTLIAELSITIDEPALREQFTQAALATFWPIASPHSDHLLETAQYNGLTMREHEVVVQMAQGQTNGEIAQALVVSKRTVETHIRNILYKLDFSSRAQVIAWAIERGLTKR